MFRAAIILALFLPSFCALAQKNDTLSYAAQLAALEAEMDSLSIFNLIESILSDVPTNSNELNIHLGFTSSVTSAGRDFDISQKGLSPGISFYHKKGWYTDLSSYWNSNVDPHVNPTVFSAGYFNTISDHFNYSFDYEKWFYNPNDTSQNPLSHSIGSSINFQTKWLSLGFDYSLLFGKESAHRFLGDIGTTINIGKVSIFEGVRLYPSISVQAGNSNILTLRSTEQFLGEQLSTAVGTIESFENLNANQSRILSILIINSHNSGIITTEERRALLNKLRNASSLDDSDLDTLQKISEGSFQRDQYTEENKFGILNYSLSLPLMFTIKDFSVLLNYTYSIPVSLPGELYEVDPIGYFSASISYRIPLK